MEFSEAEEHIECSKKVAEVFDLGAYHKYSLDLWYAKEKQDKEGLCLKTLLII